MPTEHTVSNLPSPISGKDSGLGDDSVVQRFLEVKDLGLGMAMVLSSEASDRLSRLLLDNGAIAGPTRCHFALSTCSFMQ